MRAAPWLALLLTAACEASEWKGVPDDRVCSPSAHSGTSICISGGRVYYCVRRADEMTCAQASAEIRCTNIVNVEAVCPGKGSGQ